MKKIVISLLLCFSVVIGVAFSPLFTSDLDENLHNCCIYPTILVCDEYTSHGSGVVVRSEKVDDYYLNVAITCDHVISHGNPLRVYISHYADWSESVGRTDHPAFVYATSPDIDMAVLVFKTDFPVATATINATVKLYDGNDVVGVGCSQLSNPRIDYGKITQVARDHYRSSMAAIPGDSGGPVFHKYELIGIKRSISVISFRDTLAPLFNISQIVPIHKLFDWSVKENGGLDFVFDNSKPLPLLSKLIPNLQINPPNSSPFDHKYPFLPN